ncbi:MAG: hypothetical protein Ta2B_12550 [Termitinemataceae bacterium]|nr:MAG: hypothetical protein Ta2B_12550 [Termitinemataceae bacterium]
MRLGTTILCALLFALIIKLFFFDFIIVDGDSMLPTLNNGKVLIVNRLAYGFRPFMLSRYLLSWGGVKAGDIVVFWTPRNELAVKRCGEIFIAGGLTFFSALGDNSLESFDSRSYGSVPVDNIIGKVVGID